METGLNVCHLSQANKMSCYDYYEFFFHNNKRVFFVAVATAVAKVKT